jgi:hypothetical protein
MRAAFARSILLSATVGLPGFLVNCGCLRLHRQQRPQRLLWRQAVEAQALFVIGHITGADTNRRPFDATAGVLIFYGQVWARSAKTSGRCARG